MNYKHLLSGTFFAPNFKDVFTLTHNLLESKPNRDILPWNDIDSLWTNPDYLTGALVMVHYQKYCDYEYTWSKGKLNMGLLIEVCKEVTGFLRMTRLMSNPNYYGLNKTISNTNISENDIIGYGTLKEAYKSSDNDPYETAGGYRHYVADIGTKIMFEIDTMNRLHAIVPSSLIIDHYNSNFFGVSTGNGTTRYNMGERIENRTVMIGYDVKQIPNKLVLEDITFDFEKATNIAQNNIDSLISRQESSSIFSY